MARCPPRRVSLFRNAAWRFTRPRVQVRNDDAKSLSADTRCYSVSNAVNVSLGGEVEGVGFPGTGEDGC
jgi:hypothetical protein